MEEQKQQQGGDASSKPLLEVCMRVCEYGASHKLFELVCPDRVS